MCIYSQILLKFLRNNFLFWDICFLIIVFLAGDILIFARACLFDYTAYLAKRKKNNIGVVIIFLKIYL